MHAHQWLGVLSLVGALSSAPASAQERGRSDSLRLVAGWDVARQQSHDVTLTFTLSRTLDPKEGRLAAVVGYSDLSALLDVRGTRVRLPLRGERLPAEDLVVETYLVDIQGAWRELARFPLRRLTRAGFEALSLQPRLNLQSAGQLDARLPVGAPPPDRSAVYQDVTVEAGFDGALKRDGWNVAWQGALTGASHAPARLRAAQLGSDAPAVDLAAYNVRATRGAIALSAGHVTFGNHRLLASQFRSRGVTADVAVGRHLTIALASSAGSELVGWSDPFGLSRPRHRVRSTTAAIEAQPSRPGLLRLEFTALDGSLQPVPSFTQEAATDRETSRGVGAQLLASDASQRVRLALGVARSRFANPRDPLLASDSSFVAVRQETRAARFGEVTVEALRSKTIATIPTSLTFVVRHERSDPLYRSVAAFVQADRQQDGIDASGSAGVVQWQASLSRARDNLDEVPSLLITRTHNYSVNAAAPVAALMRAPNAWWLPVLTIGWSAVQQTGDSTPPNGGFRTLAQIPDQRSGNLGTSATWQGAQWNASYRAGRSLVDNRQPTRERADVATITHAITLGRTLAHASFAVDLSRESLESKELGHVAVNQRLGAQGEWSPFRHSAFAAAVTLADARDDNATTRGRNIEMRFEVTQGFNVWVRPPDGSQARAFVRWSRAAAMQRTVGMRRASVVQWTLDGGLSLRLF